MQVSTPFKLREKVRIAGKEEEKPQDRVFLL